MEARGWTVRVLNPSTNEEKAVLIAAPAPINAQAAAELAKAKIRGALQVPPSHQLFVSGITPATVGMAMLAPKCTAFESCTNTAREDGICGKHFHSAKQEAAQS